MLDLALEENLETRFSSVLANNDPEAIATLLPQDTVLLGLADSGAHISQLCDACFATDLLGNWVRDKEVMPFEKAIYKLTGEPAEVFGLRDRGTLEVGKAADVVVLDADTIDPGPLRRIRDFPADGERLVADAPVGVRHVMVNGTVIREDDKPLDDALAARPGRLLEELVASVAVRRGTGRRTATVRSRRRRGRPPPAPSTRGRRRPCRRGPGLRMADRAPVRARRRSPSAATSWWNVRRVKNRTWPASRMPRRS